MPVREKIEALWEIGGKNMNEGDFWTTVLS